MSVLVEPGYMSTYPLNHARIMWNSVITGAEATGARANFPASAALTKTTYERWSPAVTGDSITFTFPRQYINCIALAAHSNLTPTVEVRVFGEWQTITAYPPGDGPSLSLDFAADDYAVLEYSPDNEAIIFLIQKRLADAVRITVDYDGAAPTLGVVMAGTALEMQRPLFGGHSPAMLTSDSKVQPNVSESGEWLGASLLRQGRPVNISWSNVQAAWVRKYWQPFAQGLKTNPFVVAWNPLRASADAIYCSSSDQPSPSNSGTRDLQSVSLTARGYSDGTDPVVEPLVGKDLLDLVTFTRPDPGTYYDAQGVLRTAAIDEPRLTYDPETGEALGLLIEEERKRLNTIAAAPTDPENVTVADAAHTISFFGTGTVNLTGVATETLAGTGDDQRVTLTFTPTAGTLTITPTGTVENLQLEAGSFSTSPITWDEGSQATRGADNAGVLLGAEFNQNQGTAFSEFIVVPSDSDNYNSPCVLFENISNRIGFLPRAGNTSRIYQGSSSTDLLVSQISLGSRVKVAFSYSEGHVSVAVNGSVIADGLSQDFSAVGSAIKYDVSKAGGAQFPTQAIRRRFIPRALSATQLEALTVP